MTVHELIKKLLKYPDDIEVRVHAQLGKSGYCLAIQDIDSEKTDGELDEIIIDCHYIEEKE